MNRLLSFLKIDLRLMKPYYKSILITIGLGLVMGILLKSPTVLSSFLMVLLILFMSYPFAIAEKNNISLLYGTLPVNRKTIVVGRYLIVLLFALLAAVLSFLCSWILTIALKQDVAFSELIPITCAMFAVSSIAVSIQYPIFFKFGYTKAKIATLIPLLMVFSVFLFIPMLSKLFNFNLSLTAMLSSFMNYPLAFGLGFLIGGIALLSLSCLISYKLFAKNDI